MFYLKPEVFVLIIKSFIGMIIFPNCFPVNFCTVQFFLPFLLNWQSNNFFHNSTMIIIFYSSIGDMSLNFLVLVPHTKPSGNVIHRPTS